MAEDFNRFEQDYFPEPRVRPKTPRPNFLPLLIIVSLLAMIFLVRAPFMLESDVEDLSISAFQVALKNDQIKSIVIEGDELISGDFHNQTDSKKHYRVDVNKQYIDANLKSWQELGDGQKEPGSNVYTLRPVDVKVQRPSRLLAILVNVLPWLIFFGFIWWLLFRQLRSANGAGSILSFGRSRAVISKEKTGVSFSDVAGIDEAKDEVKELVDFLRQPEKFKKIGARIPHGVLLIGPPGTGKTLLAKAIAGEAGVPFFSISGSDFVEMFVGVGASRVRDLFKRAKESAPCIIFLDEIDAVGRKRGSGFGGGNDEREQTLNAILVEMDGFESEATVIVIAATNRPDVLDPALRRPGRFDREIMVDLPDLEGREQILKVHAKKVMLAADVDLKTIARGTPTFSGAELANLINEAAIVAALKNRTVVAMQDLEEARDKVRWGRQKKARVMPLEDQRVTAYHEAGHVVSTLMLKHADPLHKVSIIPRGMALGATMSLPERDSYGHNRAHLIDTIKTLYGGRVGEELFCGDISTGAQNDIERATRIARLMVTDWGMSNNIGPINYTQPDDGGPVWAGGSGDTVHISPEVQEKIDEEIRSILLTCHTEVRELLNANRDKVDKVAQALMRYETLTAEEVKRLVEGAEVDSLKPAPTQRVLKTPEEHAELKRREAEQNQTDELKRRGDTVKEKIQLTPRPLEP